MRNARAAAVLAIIVALFLAAAPHAHVGSTIGGRGQSDDAN